MQEHAMKFGKGKSTIGYSKAMLEDAMHYEEAMRKKQLEIKRKDFKDSVTETNL